MRKPEIAFIDPSVVTPRELGNAEMSDLSGGFILTVAVWATACGYPLAIGVVATASTIVK